MPMSAQAASRVANDNAGVFWSHLISAFNGTQIGNEMLCAFLNSFADRRVR